jgi:hypothetical protein
MEFRMKVSVVFAVLSMLAAPALAGTPPSIQGEYVEARTAEVFAGGCVMSSEAETIGREAVMAWRISKGSYDGVALDGLSVVAAVAGNRNLGIREIGGEAPSVVRAAIIVDERASEAQRRSLVKLVGAMSDGLIKDVVHVASAPIRFASTPHQVEVSAGDARLAVQRHVHHDPNCGAMQWFHPLASGTDATLGMAEVHVFSGRALGTRWSDPNKKSAFVGAFSY